MVLKGLSFVHVNCRSLYRKNAQMNVLFSDYDIICCSETWLSKAFLDHLVSLPGKTIFRIDRTTRGNKIVRKKLMQLTLSQVKYMYVCMYVYKNVMVITNL